jgi:hypothetical protein
MQAVDQGRRGIRRSVSVKEADKKVATTSAAADAGTLTELTQPHEEAEVTDLQKCYEYILSTKSLGPLIKYICNF